MRPKGIEGERKGVGRAVLYDLCDQSDLGDVGGGVVLGFRMKNDYLSISYLDTYLKFVPVDCFSGTVFLWCYQYPGSAQTPHPCSCRFSLCLYYLFYFPRLLCCILGVDEN